MIQPTALVSPLPLTLSPTPPSAGDGTAFDASLAALLVSAPALGQPVAAPGNPLPPAVPVAEPVIVAEPAKPSPMTSLAGPVELATTLPPIPAPDAAAETNQQAPVDAPLTTTLLAAALAEPAITTPSAAALNQQTTAPLPLVATAQQETAVPAPPVPQAGALPIAASPFQAPPRSVAPGPARTRALPHTEPSSVPETAIVDGTDVSAPQSEDDDPRKPQAVAAAPAATDLPQPGPAPIPPQPSHEAVTPPSPTSADQAPAAGVVSVETPAPFTPAAPVTSREISSSLASPVEQEGPRLATTVEIPPQSAVSTPVANQQPDAALVAVPQADPMPAPQQASRRAPLPTSPQPQAAPPSPPIERHAARTSEIVGAGLTTDRPPVQQEVAAQLHQEAQTASAAAAPVHSAADVEPGKAGAIAVTVQPHRIVAAQPSSPTSPPYTQNLPPPSDTGSLSDSPAASVADPVTPRENRPASTPAQPMSAPATAAPSTSTPSRTVEIASAPPPQLATAEPQGASAAPAMEPSVEAEPQAPPVAPSVNAEKLISRSAQVAVNPVRAASDMVGEAVPSIAPEVGMPTPRMTATAGAAPMPAPIVNDVRSQPIADARVFATSASALTPSASSTPMPAPVAAVAPVQPEAHSPSPAAPAATSAMAEAPVVPVSQSTTTAALPSSEASPRPARADTRAALIPAAPSAAQPNPTPLVAGATAPAFRLFAAAIHAARTEERDRALPLTAAPLAAAVEQPGIAVASVTQSAPLDMTDRRWPHTMVAHIERLQETASAARDAASTSIRLVPDALGTVDVSLRTQGDTVHVHFTAERPATRTLLAEAQPRLTELAEARGIKLAQTNVSGGSDGGQRQQPAPQPQSRTNRAPAPAVQRDDLETATTRVA